MAAMRISCGEFDYPCLSAIFVPEIALDEPGYIRSWTAGNSVQDKHELHALAQTACFRFQDDELAVTEISGPCRVILPDGNEEITAGMIIFRLAEGDIRAAAHTGLNKRKLLEAAYRYCTRWVRLDI